MFLAHRSNVKRQIRNAAAIFFVSVFFQASLTALANEGVAERCNSEALVSIPDRDRQPASISDLSYPPKCLHSALEVEDVILKFDVRKNGKPTNVKALASANKCLASHAVKAAKSWEYSCVGDGLSGVEVKISYYSRDKRFALGAASYTPEKCDHSAAGLDFATPVSRMPPAYPERCMYKAEKKEEVLVAYDVLPSGATDNFRVSKSTNECLNSAAVASVARWIYKCTSDGKLDLETVITFQLEGEVSPPTHKGVSMCYLFDHSKYKAADIIRDPSLGQSCEKTPYYAWQCSWKAGKKEYVALSFRVTPEGSVQGIEVDKSTDACFDDFAKMTLSQKQYAPSSSGYDNIGAVFVYEKLKLDEHEKKELENN